MTRKKDVLSGKVSRESAKPPSEVAGIKQLVNVELSRLRLDPTQPREHFEERGLEELAGSIADQGLIQPISVIEQEAGYYLIVSGERRFRAHQILGKKQIQAVVLHACDLGLARLAENIHRRDLLPIELAHALKKLQEERDWTQEQLARFINKDRSNVSRILSINNLPGSIQEECAMSHKVTLSALEELAQMSEEDQVEVWPQLRDKKVTVRELRAMRARKTYQEKPPIDHVRKASANLIKWLKIVDPAKISEEEIDILIARSRQIDSLLKKLKDKLT